MSQNKAQHMTVLERVPGISESSPELYLSKLPSPQFYTGKKDSGLAYPGVSVFSHR